MINLTQTALKITLKQMGHLSHTPFSQGSGIIEERRRKLVRTREVDEHSKQCPPIEMNSKWLR